MAGLRMLPRASVALASCGLVSATFLSQSKLYAEEASPFYPTPKPAVTLVPVQTELQTQIGVVRRHLESATSESRAWLHGLVDRWVGVEQSVERRVKSLVPADEPVVPGLLYVGVATLAGSIYGRYRSLPVRLLAPPTAFVLSMAYFQPGLSHNLLGYYKELEGAHLPKQVAEQREYAETQLANVRETTFKSTKEAAQTVQTWLHDGLVFVQNSTGLTVAPNATPATHQPGEGVPVPTK